MTEHHQNDSYTDLWLFSKNGERIKAEAVLYIEKDRQFLFTNQGHIFRTNNLIESLSVHEYIDRYLSDVADIMQLSTLRYPMIDIPIPRSELNDFGLDAEDLSGFLKYRLIWDIFTPERRN